MKWNWFQGQRNFRKKWENKPYYRWAFDGHKYISINDSGKQEAKESIKNIGAWFKIMAPHIPNPLCFVAKYFTLKNLAILDLFVWLLVIFVGPFYRN